MKVIVTLLVMNSQIQILYFSTLHKKVSYRAEATKLSGISVLLKDA